MRGPVLLALLSSLCAASLSAQVARHPCFGVRILPAGGCSAFILIEGGGRMMLTPDRDRSESDPAHAYPVLRNHGFLAAGLAWPAGDRAALGVVGEIGGGDGRQGIGVRYDYRLTPRLRLDLTGGAMRVETHQVNVVRRRMTAGPFADATLHFTDLLAVQARAERFAGDGARIKPGSAVYLGARIEGKSGLAASGTFVALAWVTVVVLYFAAGD